MVKYLCENWGKVVGEQRKSRVQMRGLFTQLSVVVFDLCTFAQVFTRDSRVFSYTFSPSIFTNLTDKITGFSPLSTLPTITTTYLIKYFVVCN